jgi:hypothetical protein
VVAASVALSIGVAHADPKNPTDEERTRAGEIKKRGDDAMVSLRYADALAAYEEASALVDDPAFVYNRGRAQQMLGNYPEALALFEAFRSNAPDELKARVSGLDSLLADVRARVSTLTITSNVAGARVLVRERSRGVTPLSAPLRLNAGRASVEVSAEGYHPYRTQVDLKGGAARSLDVKLQSKDTTGLLIVTSTTAGARVALNGRPAGTVPIEVVLPAGTHRIAVRKDGFEDAETSAVLGAGDRKQVSVPLSSERSIASRWWFWTGIAAVVVGGAVVTAAFLIEEPAPKGTIEPGQVAAPIRF